METTAITQAAFRLMDQAITLNENDFNGCPVSGDELEAIMPRIKALKSFINAEGNETAKRTIVSYITGKNYGLSDTRFFRDSFAHCLTNGEWPNTCGIEYFRF
jgi:hypothetical protein